MHRSSRVSIFVLKIGTILIALISVSLWLYLMFDSDATLFINGKEFKDNPIKALVILIPALLSGLFYYFYILPLRFLTMDSDIVRIREKGKITSYPWEKIECLSKIRFVLVPTYRMNIRGKKSTVYFITTFFSLPFGVDRLDYSKMGKFVMEREEYFG